MNNNELMLTIAGQTLAVTHELVPVDSLSLDKDNPRIRLLVQRRFKDKAPTQEDLAKLIKEQNSYDNLHKAIRKAEGINDPVIVSHDGLVIEGNCRTVVMKTLRATPSAGTKWDMIPVRRLAKGFDPKLFGLLTASYHIGGKSEWSPFAQAMHMHHLRSLGFAVETIADETRKSPKAVEQYLAAYKFLTEELLKAHGGEDADALDRKWSHALEFVKNPDLEPHRKDPEKRKVVVDLIVNKGLKGRDVRDLAPILNNKRAAAALRKDGFKAATAELQKVDPIASSELLRKLGKWTQILQELTGEDMKVFDEEKAKEVLRELHAAVVDLADSKNVKLKPQAEPKAVKPKPQTELKLVTKAKTRRG